MWGVEAYEDVELVESFQGYPTREDAETAIMQFELEDEYIGYSYAYALVPPSDSWLTAFESIDLYSHMVGDFEYDEL